MNLQMLDIKRMKTDSSYQRQPDQKRIDNIAKNWDGMKANLIYLSHRIDGYYVLDGNHTRLAAEKVGVTELPCRIYEGLSIKDEARIFTELNIAQKKPRFDEILKAKASAGCEPECGYLQCLNDAKVPHSLSPGSGKLKCHAALLRIYKKTTNDMFIRALQVACAAADERDEFYQMGFFPGMCDFIVTHPEADEVRLINVVKRTSSSKIRDTARIYRNVIMSGSASSTNEFRKAYIELYNKGLKNAKKRIKEE